MRIASGYLAGIAATWYNDNKEDLLFWDDKANPNNSFVQSLVKYFTTPKRRHQWQVELNTSVQREAEKTDKYAYRFKKLLK